MASFHPPVDVLFLRIAVRSDAIVTPGGMVTVLVPLKRMVLFGMMYMISPDFAAAILDRNSDIVLAVSELVRVG
jgi:hypothetical protein